MNLNETRLWNVFHDGSICRVSGRVPGSLELTVEIEYIRELFLPAGTAFIVQLEHCVLFRFDPYGPESVDVASTEILSCVIDEDSLKVFCVDGILYMNYHAAHVTLESGMPVTLSQLEATAQAYWDDCSERGA